MESWKIFSCALSYTFYLSIFEKPRLFKQSRTFSSVFCWFAHGKRCNNMSRKCVLRQPLLISSEVQIGNPPTYSFFANEKVKLHLLYFFLCVWKSFTKPKDHSKLRSIQRIWFPSWRLFEMCRQSSASSRQLLSSRYNWKNKRLPSILLCLFYIVPPPWNWAPINRRPNRESGHPPNFGVNRFEKCSIARPNRPAEFRWLMSDEVWTKSDLETRH